MMYDSKIYIWVIFQLKIKLLHALHGSPKVLLISLDGFRWDFRSKTSTPCLDNIVKNGVSSKYVKNVFPTSTLPNHQSIVTGLYPEHHGIIDNTFLDPSGRIFKGTLGDSRIDMWNQSLPIWTVNEMQGHKSGVLFWPGYRVKYENRLPSYLPPYKYEPFRDYKDQNTTEMSLKTRINLAISWLKHDDVNLVLLHALPVDNAAHNNGADSRHKKNAGVLKKAIRSVDCGLKYLNTRLKEERLSDDVNVIIIGDHGHVNTSYLHNLHLDDVLDTKKNIRFIGTFTNVFIYPKAGRTKFLYDELKNVTAEMKHYSVYLKKDIPDSFHVKNNNRTADILLLPDPGWTVTCSINKVPYLKGKWERGDHGYANYYRVMSPAFFAFGPAFRKGYRKKCIHTVDIYSLITHILKIKPLKNDGKFDRIKSVLAEFESKDD